jgi:branched-chain amino acid transport system substrate-binding protein
MGKRGIIACMGLVFLLFSTSHSAESVKIGMVVTSTGAQGYLGESAIKGAEAIIYKVNKEGGINGRNIELIQYNDEGKEEKAILGFQKMVKQFQVAAISGGSVVGTADAIAKVNKNGPVVVSPSGGFIPEGDSYMFASGGVSSRDILKFLFSKWFKEKGYKKIALLAGLYGSGQEWVKYSEKYSKDYPGCELQIERFKLTDVDVIAQLTRLKSWKPDMLIVSAVGKSPVMVAKNFNQIGMSIPILFSHSNASPFFLELLGGDRPPKSPIFFPGFAIHIWQELPDTHPQKKICKELSDNYKAVHKEDIKDPYFVGEGADTLLALTSALKAVGTDPKKMKDFLESFTLVGTTAICHYSKEDHLGSDMSSLFILTAEGNKFKLPR